MGGLQSLFLCCCIQGISTRLKFEYFRAFKKTVMPSRQLDHGQVKTNVTSLLLVRGLSPLNDQQWASSCDSCSKETGHRGLEVSQWSTCTMARQWHLCGWLSFYQDLSFCNKADNHPTTLLETQQYKHDGAGEWWQHHVWSMERTVKGTIITIVMAIIDYYFLLLPTTRLTRWALQIEQGLCKINICCDMAVIFQHLQDFKIFQTSTKLPLTWDCTG